MFSLNYSVWTGRKLYAKRINAKRKWIIPVKQRAWTSRRPSLLRWCMFYPLTLYFRSFLAQVREHSPRHTNAAIKPLIVRYRRGSSYTFGLFDMCTHAINTNTLIYSCTIYTYLIAVYGSVCVRLRRRLTRLLLFSQSKSDYVYEWSRYFASPHNFRRFLLINV